MWLISKCLSTIDNLIEYVFSSSEEFKESKSPSTILGRSPFFCSPHSSIPGPCFREVVIYIAVCYVLQDRLRYFLGDNFPPPCYMSSQLQSAIFC